jgi:puromycin-sensitive aminopeptidase
MSDLNPYRLPRAVLPRHYRLRLEPDLGAASFAGAVEVDIEVVEPTKEVVLNALELEIDDAWVQSAGRRLPAVVSLDAGTERATLSLPEALSPGDALVGLRFRGTLNDKLRGFYRSTFTGTDGAQHTIACTQFEATDARRAFPCWDEPDLKATFAITVVVERGLSVVSNGGEISERATADGRREIAFSPTMPMSTYLVAVVVGPLETAGPVLVDGAPVRVLCPPGKLALTDFALEVAAFSLRYFADYFDLPYPADTLDLVAIPDFAFGAMENLGCVTFRETLLLVDPARATQQELQNVVDVIAHELAHMWFGDLVTMRWWNGIWLNEAFATFMELRATDAFRPAWQRWVSFGLSRSSALDTDSLATTRAVEYPVISPQDAEGMFDVLTYEKGAAVVRMLEQYLGEDRFRQAIRRYMAMHQYANTETTDLWDAIEESTAEPVRRIMDSWIFQGGYPLVTVETAAGGRVLRLSQERFAYLASDGAGDQGRWAVPLVLRYGTDDGVTTTTALLDGPALELDLPAPVRWVVANAEGSGFYRVRYSADLREALTSRCGPELTSLERYGIVDDTWAMVLAGAAPAVEALTLAEAMAAEDDVDVWRRIVATLDGLDRILYGILCGTPADSYEGTADADTPDGDASAALRRRIAAVVTPALARLREVPEDALSDRDRQLRGVLFGALAGTAGDTTARTEARRLFERFRADASSVEANLAAAALLVVAAHADAEDLEAILAGYRGSGTPQEQLRHLYSLAEVLDPVQHERVLELALSEEVRTQNAPFLLSACLGNRRNAAAAWVRIEDSWDRINERFPSNSIVRLLAGIRTISDPALAERVTAFLAGHPVPQGRRIIEQHVERMQVTVALRAREASRLAEALLT